MSTTKNMPEAEVALRLAHYVLSRCRGADEASISIDGAAAKYFSILAFLVNSGWTQTRQEGKNSWTGDYTRNGDLLRLHTRAGVGDVMIRVGNRRLIAECKKGPRQKSKNGQERRLLAETIGQAIKWKSEPGDAIFVAVPETAEFRRVAGDWLRAPLFDRSSIIIALVGEDGSVMCLKGETAAELDALLPSILNKGF